MRLVLAAFIFVSVAGQACAQEWLGAGGGEGAEAYFTVNGRPAGARITCLPGGRLEVTVAGNGARFPGDRTVTLVLSVDGTAFSGQARVEPEGPGGGSRFVRMVEAGETPALLTALKRGRSLEVSSPAGFIRLPLSGSGRALGALAPLCSSP